MSFSERRRKQPSIVMPLLYFCLELIVMWLVLSLFSTTFNPLHWAIYIYGIAALWIVFISLKLYWVLQRQKRIPND